MGKNGMKRSERIDRVELMRTFVRIVEAGSLSAAARQLATTQATVSRRLQSLETMLGVRLMLRTTHTTRLTDDGERCYQHARRVIDSWLALEDEVGQTEDEPVGVLRVRAPHAFGQDQLLKPLTEFLQRYPQLSVEWMLNDRSVDFLGDNLDCAIRVGVEVDPATVSVLLAEVPRSVVASPELLARYPAVKTPEDLQPLPWIAISSFLSTPCGAFPRCIICPGAGYHYATAEYRQPVCGAQYGTHRAGRGGGIQLDSTG